MEKIKTTSGMASQRHLFWEQAPEALLQKIIELDEKLARFRKIKQSPGSLHFYEGVLRIMRLCYTYMLDTRHIHQRNAILEANIRFLATYNAEVEQRLNEYETITRLQQHGRLEEVIQMSEAYVQSTLSAREKISANGGQQ